VGDKPSDQEYTTSEWSSEEWERAWHLRVGTAYRCAKCGSVVMLTKGGVGTLEPYCCDEPMKQMKTNQT
jgi:desulfoferrodoxin-like iron-binding protein